MNNTDKIIEILDDYLHIRVAERLAKQINSLYPIEEGFRRVDASVRTPDDQEWRFVILKDKSLAILFYGKNKKWCVDECDGEEEVYWYNEDVEYWLEPTMIYQQEVSLLESLKELDSYFMESNEEKHRVVVSYEDVWNMIESTTPTASIESEQGKEYKNKCSGCGNDDWSSIGLYCENGLHEFSVCRICGMTIFPSEMYVNNSPDQSKEQCDHFCEHVTQGIGKPVYCSNCGEELSTKANQLINKKMKDREAVTTNGRAVFYACMWNDFRQAAMDVGWTLGLHGSLASDMDIMAMPWTEDAKSPLEMALAIRRCFGKPNDITVSETEMPNNRLVYTLSIFADFYLDINIIKTPATTNKSEDNREDNQ